MGMRRQSTSQRDSEIRMREAGRDERRSYWMNDLGCISGGLHGSGRSHTEGQGLEKDVSSSTEELAGEGTAKEPGPSSLGKTEYVGI